MSTKAYQNGNERTFNRNELIVSKTNTRGIITYANDVFLKIADYSLKEVIGKPHNIIRHPEMPRCIFKLLWANLKQEKEIFAYVINKTKYGDYYWVLAHVTPSFNTQGDIIGYHSSRRVPNQEAIAKIKPLYKKLLDEERRHSLPTDAVEASFAMLVNILKESCTSYDQFVISL